MQTAQYLAGHRILDNLAFLMLGGNLGYGVVVSSYNQNIYFNFICDPRLMPDLELMANGVDDAFAELLALADRSQADAAEKTKSAAAEQRQAAAAN